MSLSEKAVPINETRPVIIIQINIEKEEVKFGKTSQEIIQIVYATTPGSKISLIYHSLFSSLKYLLKKTGTIKMA